MEPMGIMGLGFGMGEPCELGASGWRIPLPDLPLTSPSG